MAPQQTNYYDKSTRIEKPSEIHIWKDNLSVSILSGQGEIALSKTTDNILIHCKNKIKKTLDTLIIINNLLNKKLIQGKVQKKILSLM